MWIYVDGVDLTRSAILMIDFIIILAGGNLRVSMGLVDFTAFMVTNAVN